MEGKLVASAIARLAERDSLDQDSLRRIQDAIGILEKDYDGLGFCLSEDSDLLSQWRGYAENATGVSIGFSSEYLKWLSSENRSRDIPGFTLAKVAYEPSAHDASVAPTYLKVKDLIAAGALKMLGRRSLLTDTRTDEEIERDNASIWSAAWNLFGDTLGLLPELFRLKAPAFREEREWRLISYLVKGEKTIVRIASCTTALSLTAKSNSLSLSVTLSQKLFLVPGMAHPRRSSKTSCS